MPGAVRLILVVLLFQLAFNVYPSVWSFYAVERFGWDSGTIGLSLALFGISFAIVQGTLIGPLMRWLGESRMVIFGLVFDVVAFFLVAIISSGTIALIFVPITALSAIVSPAIHGMLSNRVPKDAQGELQGILASTGAVATILSPLLMTATFAYFTQDTAPVYLPGSPFFVAALLAALGLIVFLTRRRSDS